MVENHAGLAILVGNTHASRAARRFTRTGDNLSCILIWSCLHDRWGDHMRDCIDSRVTPPHLHLNKQALSLGKRKFLCCVYLLHKASACLKLGSSFRGRAKTAKWNGAMNLRVRVRVKSFKVLPRIRHLFDDFKSSIITSARENSEIDITVHTFFCEK